MQKLRPDLDLGGNIRRLRKRRGLRQDDVLTRMQLMGIHISRSSYAKIETNRMNIRVSELVALREILQVDYAEFFAGLMQESDIHER